MSSLFSQIRNPLMFCPMRHSEHDLDNAKTLDVSGNQNHLSLGDEITTGFFPVKIPNKPGYRDATNSQFLRRDSIFSQSESQLTVCVQCQTGFETSTAEICSLWSASGTFFRLLFLANSVQQFRFYVGANSLANAATYPANPNIEGTFCVVGVYDGTDTKIWINGKRGINATLPTAPNYQADQLIYVFNDYAGNLDFNGVVSHFGIWDVALTELEVLELTRRICSDSKVNRS